MFTAMSLMEFKVLQEDSLKLLPSSVAAQHLVRLRQICNNRSAKYSTAQKRQDSKSASLMYLATKAQQKCNLACHHPPAGAP